MISDGNGDYKVYGIQPTNREYYEHCCETFGDALEWSYWQHTHHSSYPERIVCPNGRAIDGEDLARIWWEYQRDYKGWAIKCLGDENWR